MIKLGKEYIFSNKEEKQRAEEKLTGKIVLRANMKFSMNGDFYTILIPYQNYTGKFSHSGEMEQEDIVIGANFPHFAEVKIRPFSSKDVIYLNLDEIPEQYQYLDTFVYPNVILGGANVQTASLSIEKEETSPKKQFSYTRDFNKMMFGVMLGTFGRIDDGWKFYPQFYETIMNREKLLRLYLGSPYFL